MGILSSLLLVFDCHARFFLAVRNCRAQLTLTCHYSHNRVGGCACLLFRRSFFPISSKKSGHLPITSPLDPSLFAFLRPELLPLRRSKEVWQDNLYNGGGGLLCGPLVRDSCSSDGLTSYFFSLKVTLLSRFPT